MTVRIGNNEEGEISIDQDKKFVTAQNVTAASPDTPAYVIEGVDNKVITILAGTVVAPELRDSNGEKLDKDTRVIIQKADKRGNRLGGFIVFNGTLANFDYDQMRLDPDLMRHTKQTVVLKEKQQLHVYVEIPEGANGLDEQMSRLTIGDETSDFGEPVEIVNWDSLGAPEQQAVNAMTQGAN
ncbi:hypothetical protein [Haladaptatus cibarius]|uniref:hypothetical protein n=1 Tax=Haladaptatus cibarius TaxID=453847 RepID=UPI0006792B09|nr:hypothetical protein [Haladaptatus cibarius]